MSEKILLGTRKGLLVLEQQTNDWKVIYEAFSGIPVSYACQDTRTGSLWAGLDNGHWGVKLPSF